MKLKEILRENKACHLFLALIGTVTFYMLLRNFSQVYKMLCGFFAVFAPLIAGAALAYFINPVVKLLDRRLFAWIKHQGIRWTSSVILASLLLLGGFSALLILVIPQLVQSLVSFLDHINEYADALSKTISALIPGTSASGITPWMEKTLIQDANYKEIAEKAIAWIITHRDGIIGASVSAGNGVIKTALSFMFCLYILFDLKHLTYAIARIFKAALPPAGYDRFCQLVMRSNQIFMKFFLGNLLDALIIGVACYVFMLISKLPYGLLVALIVGVTNLIPTFGPLLGAVIGGSLILLTQPTGVVAFLIYTIISQTIDGNVIKPILFGDTTGLRPLWVLTAIVVGGELFGIAGMLLGIPVIH